MTQSYIRVQDIKDLGGFVVPAFLTPNFGSFDLNDNAYAVVGELTIIDTSEANTANPTFILPEVIVSGQVCAVKNVNDTFDNVVRLIIATSGSNVLQAGIADQEITDMVFVGGVGEVAIFISQKVEEFGEPSMWNLLSYYAGSTFAP